MVVSQKCLSYTVNITKLVTEGWMRQPVYFKLYTPIFPMSFEDTFKFLVDAVNVNIVLSIAVPSELVIEYVN